MKLKMTAYEAYVLYLALKTHFLSESYDYFKYNRSIKVKEETFEKRKDKVFFQKLAKHEDVETFLVANLSVNPKIYVRGLVYSDESQKIYKEWNRKNLSLSYIFKQELFSLDEKFNNNILREDNSHPILLQKYLANDISLETLCIILSLFPNVIKYWDDVMKYDLVWESHRLKIIKYMPFVIFEKEKFKQIVLDKFN